MHQFGVQGVVEVGVEGLRDVLQRQPERVHAQRGAPVGHERQPVEAGQAAVTWTRNNLKVFLKV